MTVAEVPRGTEQVAAMSRCPLCCRGRRVVGWRRGVIVHRFVSVDPNTTGIYDYKPCPDYDSEGRHIAEPFGFYTFAWWPKLCRNGKRRWLTWVERHEDGSFTLGDRAH